MTIREFVAPADRVLSVERAPGAFENLFDLYTRQSPVQFSLVVELDRAVAPSVVEAALGRVQRAQPMLSAHIDRSAGEARFVRTGRAIPLVLPPSGTPWDAIAANEQAWPIDVTRGPLARCTLVRSSTTSSTVVMTFAHQVADGLSAAATVRDLIRAINGHELPSVEFPPAQEDLLDAISAPAAGDRASIDPTTAGLLIPATDPRMDRHGVVRPFDGSRADVDTLVWSADLTRRARARARAQSTTLHGLITAAAVRVLYATSPKDFVSVMNPMDTRGATNAGDALALYFLSTRIGISRENSVALWPLARDIRTLVQLAQQPRQLVATSSGMRDGSAFVQTPADAAAAMAAFANYDLMVTNVGALDRPADSTAQDAVRIVDLFGPVMVTQIEGEQILAVSSFDGRLRTTVTTRTPIPRFLTRIRDEVENALAVDPSAIAGY